MSALWNVKLINRGERWVDLEVTQVHPDADAFCNDETFALGLIATPLLSKPKKRSSKTFPLEEKIDLKALWNLDYLDEIATTIVSAVTIYKVLNLAEPGYFPADPEAEDALFPQALYRIEVTQPAWIAHLSLDQGYSSAASSNDVASEGFDQETVLEMPGDAQRKSRKTSSRS